MSAADGEGDENSPPPLPPPPPPPPDLPPPLAPVDQARRDPAIRQKRIFEDTPSSINSEDLDDDPDEAGNDDDNEGEASPTDAAIPDGDVADEEVAAAAGDLLSRRFGSGDLGEGYRSVAHKKLYYSYLKRSAEPDSEEDEDQDDDEEEDDDDDEEAEEAQCSINGANCAAWPARRGRASRGKRIFEGEEDDEDENSDEASGKLDSAVSNGASAAGAVGRHRGKRIFECDGEEDNEESPAPVRGSARRPPPLSSLAAFAAAAATASASATSGLSDLPERRKRKKQKSTKRSRQRSNDEDDSRSNKHWRVLKRPRGRCKAMYESSASSEGSDDEEGDRDSDLKDGSGASDNDDDGASSGYDVSELAGASAKGRPPRPLQEALVSSTAAAALDAIAVSPLGGLNLAAALIDHQRQPAGGTVGGGGLQRQNSMDDIFESVRGLEASGLSVEAVFASAAAVSAASQSSNLQSTAAATVAATASVVSTAPASFGFEADDADELPMSLLPTIDDVVGVGDDSAAGVPTVEDQAVPPTLPFPPLAVPLYIDGGDKDA